MEENNMNNQVTENNDIRKTNNGNNIAIALFVIGLILIGIAGYKLFVEKPQSDNTQEKEKDTSIKEIGKYELSENEKEFSLNNKIIKIKAVNNKVYVDGKEASYYGDAADAYVTNKFILIIAKAQTNTYPVAINENGEVIDVIGNTDTPATEISNLRIENGKLVATKSSDFSSDGEIKVEFVYEKDKITIKEIESDNSNKNND